MKTPKEKLLTVTSADDDLQVAKLIADKLIVGARSEWYRYQINHDTRPPKCLACPVVYDWAVKDRVGIATTNKAHARKWLTDVALAGYRIEEVDANRKPLLGEWIESIDTARKRAELFRRPKVDDDDDIPF
jgi:hypothetical protein